MSRVANNPINVPDTVNLSVNDNVVAVKGNKGELDFSYIIPEIYKIGYKGLIGAEYKPRTTTDEGIAWMDNFK